MASWSIHDNKELTVKYQILGHIGSGSYADVYRAHRKADGLEVALKEVHDYQSACREIDALSNLVGHPHVVQLLEYLWLSEDSVVLVLEFLLSDLSAVINQRRKEQHPAAPDVMGIYSYAGNTGPGMADIDTSFFHTDSIEARSEIWAAAAPSEFGFEPGMQGVTGSFCFETGSQSITHDAHDLCHSDVACSETRVQREEVRNLANSHHVRVIPNAQDLTMDTRDMAGSPNNKFEHLTERKQQDTLEEAEVKGWMIQILKGVASCHSEGFLHRDLKPSNMLISPSGILKIADFGQARALGPQGKVSTLPVVNYCDIASQPKQAPDQREPLNQREQGRIASLVATFHKETVERRMDVEEAETPSPFIVKGIAELQSESRVSNTICLLMWITD
ncbi:hypothetical protein GOP47_0027852 [Adiantum capillus-veneris]|nr:hypothetical protein GOP47_0027852 [Adiantum capillus-veneris]